METAPPSDQSGNESAPHSAEGDSLPVPSSTSSETLRKSAASTRWSEDDFEKAALEAAVAFAALTHSTLSAQTGVDAGGADVPALPGGFFPDEAKEEKEEASLKSNQRPPERGGDSSETASDFSSLLPSGQFSATKCLTRCQAGSLWLPSAAIHASEYSAQQKTGGECQLEKRAWLTQQQACDIYCLSEEAVKAEAAAGRLELRLLPNPKSASFKPMRLYLRRQVEDLAASVWGSLEAAFQERERRIEERWKRKTRGFEKEQAKRKRQSAREGGSRKLLQKKVQNIAAVASTQPSGTPLARTLPEVEWEEV